MLRLSHALHEASPDPSARKRVLLEGLCRLLRADAGVCVVSREQGRLSVTVSVVRHAMTEDDARALAGSYRFARRRRGNPHRDVPPDDTADSVLDVKGLKVRVCVALLRRRPAARRFTPRDRAVLELLHAELAWVYGPDVPPLSPDGVPLSPRQRQTLQLLLAGNSEKEIGRELLARWVRK